MNAIRPSKAPFVVFTLGRTGSSYLQEALDSHPQIEMASEILVPLREKPIAQLKAAMKLWRGGDGRSLAAGFKTKFGDIANKGVFADAMRKSQVRIIWMRRGNIVKHAVSCHASLLLYQQTGNWNVYREEQKLEPIMIEPLTLWSSVSYLQREDARFAGYIAALNLPCMELYYEEFCSNYENSIRAVCEFLAVPYIPVKGRALKAMSPNLREALGNYDELQAMFVGTSFYEMFEEMCW